MATPYLTAQNVSFEIPASSKHKFDIPIVDANGAPLDVTTGFDFSLFFWSPNSRNTLGGHDLLAGGAAWPFTPDDGFITIDLARASWSANLQIKDIVYALYLWESGGSVTDRSLAAYGGMTYLDLPEE